MPKVSSRCAGSDDAEEVLFVSAGGLVSRILVSAITIQSRTAKGIAMLNLQVQLWRTYVLWLGCRPVQSELLPGVSVLLNLQPSNDTLF